MEIELEAVNLAGAPQVAITVTNLPTSAQTVTVERLTPHGFTMVRGGKNLDVVGGSFFLLDHTPPLNVAATYRVTIKGGAATTATITVPSRLGWLSDPLNPKNALPVSHRWEPGALLLTTTPVAELPAPIDLAYPMGARRPVAAIGVRSAATNIPLSFLMDAQTASLAENLFDCGQLVLRGHDIALLDDVAEFILPDLTRATASRETHLFAGTATVVRPIAPTFKVVWFSFDELTVFLTENLGTGASFADLKNATEPGSTFFDIAKDKTLLVGG